MDRPTENAIEREAQQNAPDDEIADEPELLPEPVHSLSTGLLLVPGFRFSGTANDPPWNWPEEDVFNWLTLTDIEILEDRVLSGLNGDFWGRVIQPDGAIQSVIVKFAGIGNDVLMNTWGAEFVLESNADFVTRSAVSYEIVKALGAEDLGFPMCLRDLNPVELVSGPARDRIASNLRTSIDKVDERLGMVGSVQLCTRDSENFCEYWALSGSLDEERWASASDALRYSMYRAYFIDFILGTPNRNVAGFVYNRNTDKLMMPDLTMSFPHSGFTAEKYMQMRTKGWGRSAGGAARFVDNSPPTANDFSRLFADLSEQHLEEAILVAQQIAARMNDEMVGRVALAMLEYEIPAECVASLILRIAYLGMSPGSVVKRPIEFIRNVCVPVRAGGELDDKTQEVIGYVNEMMTNIMEEQFDLTEVLSQPLSDLTELLV